jgi:hypothetical protein
VWKENKKVVTGDEEHPNKSKKTENECQNVRNDFMFYVICCDNYENRKHHGIISININEHESAKVKKALSLAKQNSKDKSSGKLDYWILDGDFCFTTFTPTP